MQKILEGFDFKLASYTFNQDDFTAMAASLGIDSLDDEHRATLLRECDRFMALIASWEQASRQVGIRKKLAKVHSDVVRLMKTLHALHDANAPDRPTRQSTLALLHSAAPGNNWSDKYGDMFAFTERLVELDKAANIALQELPEDRGGPSGDLPLKVLATGLADLFTEVTGKKPSITSDQYAESEAEFRGGFLDFVEAFLRPLAPHYTKKRRTLGKALKRILGNRTHSS